MALFESRNKQTCTRSLADTWNPAVKEQGFWEADTYISGPNRLCSFSSHDWYNWSQTEPLHEQESLPEPAVCKISAGLLTVPVALGNTLYCQTWVQNERVVVYWFWGGKCGSPCSGDFLVSFSQGMFLAMYSPHVAEDPLSTVVSVWLLRSMWR